MDNDTNRLDMLRGDLTSRNLHSFEQSREVMSELSSTGNDRVTYVGDHGDIESAIQEGFRKVSADLKSAQSSARIGVGKLGNDLRFMGESATIGGRNVASDLRGIGLGIQGMSMGIHESVASSGLKESLLSNAFRSSRSLTQDLLALMGRNYVDVRNSDARRLAGEAMEYRAQSFALALTPPGFGWMKTDLDTAYDSRRRMESMGRFEVSSEFSGSDRGFGYTQEEKKLVSQTLAGMRRSFLVRKEDFGRESLDNIMTIAGDAGAFKSFSKEDVGLLPEKMKAVKENVKEAMQVLQMTEEEAAKAVGELSFRGFSRVGQKRVIHNLNKAAAARGTSGQRILQLAQIEATEAYEGGSNYNAALETAIAKLENLGGADRYNTEGKEEEIDNESKEFIAKNSAFFFGINDKGLLDVNMENMIRYASGNISREEIAKITASNVDKLDPKGRFLISSVTPDNVLSIISPMSGDEAAKGILTGVGASSKIIKSFQEYKVTTGSENLSLGKFLNDPIAKITYGIDSDDVNIYRDYMKKLESLLRKAEGNVTIHQVKQEPFVYNRNRSAGYTRKMLKTASVYGNLIGGGALPRRDQPDELFPLQDEYVSLGTMPATNLPMPMDQDKAFSDAHFIYQNDAVVRQHKAIMHLWQLVVGKE